MSIRDWFKTRNRLELERDWAWDAHDRLTHAIDSVDSLEELKKFRDGEMAKEPVLVMPGSDIGQGELRLKHWASKLLARAAMDMLNSYPDTDNYLTVTMNDPKTGKMIDLTFQRKEYGKLTPSEKATKLTEEVSTLKLLLERARGTKMCQLCHVNYEKKQPHDPECPIAIYDAKYGVKTLGENSGKQEVA